MSFYCKLSNVKYNRFENVETDVYMWGNFDNYLDIYSPIKRHTKDAEYKDWIRIFKYQTQYIKHIKLKTFQIKMYEPSLLWFDKCLGECEIDLYTLATGPKNYRISLKKDGASVGVLEFTFVFKCFSDVHFYFENLCFQTNGLKENKRYFLYYCGSETMDFETTDKLDQEARKEKKKQGIPEEQYDSNNLKWDKLPPLITRLSWVDLLNEVIMLRLDDGMIDGANSEGSGVAFVYLVNVLSAPINNESSFVLPIIKTQKKTGEKTHIGQVTGNIKVKYEPVYAQMIGGWYHDGVIKEAIPFFDGLPLPDGIKKQE